MIIKPCRILGTFLLLCLIGIVPVLADTWENNWAPWVTNTTTTSATINWRQDSVGSGSIAYVKTSDYTRTGRFDTTITDASTTPYHHTQLTGLDPGISYTYSVKPFGNPGVFSPRVFRTMPESGPYTFVVISDAQEGSEYSEDLRFHYVADAIAKEPDVLFILSAGDHARFDNFHRWSIFFHNANGMLSNTTIFPATGNHEYHDINNGNIPLPATYYHYAFPGPLNYSFDVAGIRYIVLNTPDPNQAILEQTDNPTPSLNLTLSQVSWLKSQLNNRLQGTFTLQHNPNWLDSLTTVDPRYAPWDDLYQEYGISASFSGHIHAYERYSIKGIPYFIVGNAGGPAADIQTTPPSGYQGGSTRRLGYLKVTVDPANNSATAREIIVGYAYGNNDNLTPFIYPSPVTDEIVTFSLKRSLSPDSNPKIAETMPKEETGGLSPFLLAAVSGVILVIGASTIVLLRKKR